jgi:tetratricopeptide (TPR) repeat protein
MSLLGAALALSFMLADPPGQPLAAQISAERARNTSLPPTLPTPPPRFAPHLRAVEQREDSCGDCRLQPLRKIKPVDPNSPGYEALLMAFVHHFDAKRQYFLDQSNALADSLDNAIRDRKKALADQLRSKRRKFQAQTVEAIEQMVKLLKLLVTTPKLAASPPAEEAHYLYIVELDELGRRAESSDAQTSFTQRYPNSRYQIHLDILAGHRALATNDLTAARATFERVLTDPRSELHATAHLALGWSHMRSEAGEAPRPDLALASFIRAIETAIPDAPPTTHTQSAHDGLVHAFAAAGRPKHAFDLFARLTAATPPAERRAIALLERLALAYFARGQHRESAEVYRELMRRHPEDPQRCTWQHRLLLTVAATQDRDAQLRETLELADTWRRMRDTNHRQAIKRQCRDDALAALTGMATHWHTAAELCATHTSLFPRDPPPSLCPTSHP